MDTTCKILKNYEKKSFRRRKESERERERIIFEEQRKNSWMDEKSTSLSLSEKGKKVVRYLQWKKVKY